MDERLRFLARLLDGEKMAPLCVACGISRKTGDKIYERCKDCGVEGLTDRSRRPYRHANQLPMVIEKLILALKRGYPAWGDGLSTLAVWWLRLGIRLERIKPGHPEQHGRHEGIHLTLKTEATTPAAAANLLQQQARCDAFIERYNHERPHQALAMRVPGDVYTRSSRLHRGLEDLDYPLHHWRRSSPTAGASASTGGK